MHVKNKMIQIHIFGQLLLPCRLLVLVPAPPGWVTSSPRGAFRDPAQAQSSRKTAARLILSDTPATGNYRPPRVRYLTVTGPGTDTSGTPSQFLSPVTSRERQQLGLTWVGVEVTVTFFLSYRSFGLDRPMAGKTPLLH